MSKNLAAVKDFSKPLNQFLAISGMEIEENFLRIEICTRAEKNTDPLPWKLTFLAMKMTKILEPKFGLLTGKNKNSKGFSIFFNNYPRKCQKTSDS